MRQELIIRKGFVLIMSSSIWKLPELIPPQQWEMNLVNSTGFTLSMIRFAVAFFASLPVAMILRRITSPKGML